MSLSSPLFALRAMVPLVATLLLGAQLKLAYLNELIGRPRALVVGLAGQLLLLGFGWIALLGGRAVPSGSGAPTSSRLVMR